MGVLDVLNRTPSGLGGRGGRDETMSPSALAIVGLLAFKVVKRNRLGSADAPGLGDRLQDLLRTARGGTCVGGGLGAMVTGGLRDLEKQFQSAGKGDVVESWIGTGQNTLIAPADLGKVLTNEQMEFLCRCTGLSREQLLRELSFLLPTAVDHLTRNGRLPTSGEVDNAF